MSDQDSGDRQLFASVARLRGRRRPGYSLPASVLAHAVLITLIVLLPILGALDPPALAKGSRIFVVSPPAAAAPPLPRGEAEGRVKKPAQTAPTVEPETPPVEVPAQAPEEREVLDTQPAGSPDGSDRGVADGMVGGSEGGTQGGVPWGVVGGCPGCDGDGPVTDWDQPPRLLRQTRPFYPQEAFIKKIEGTVLLEILIDANGDVAATRLLRSVSPALDQAAAQTVRQWRFAPAVRRGRPVATWAQAPVQFRIY